MLFVLEGKPLQTIVSQWLGFEPKTLMDKGKGKMDGLSVNTELVTIGCIQSYLI